MRNMRTKEIKYVNRTVSRRRFIQMAAMSIPSLAAATTHGQPNAGNRFHDHHSHPTILSENGHWNLDCPATSDERKVIDSKQQQKRPTPKEEYVMQVLFLYHSTYGHIHKMAEAMAEGVAEVGGAEAVLRRVPETLPAEVIEKMGAVEAQKGMSHIPLATVDELASADAVIFGTPTRFGNMCGQMRQFLDATGQLRAQGALVGKVGSVFTSTATQHGGQESTIHDTAHVCGAEKFGISKDRSTSRSRANPCPRL